MIKVIMVVKLADEAESAYNRCSNLTYRTPSHSIFQVVLEGTNIPRFPEETLRCRNERAESTPPDGGSGLPSRPVLCAPP